MTGGSQQIKFGETYAKSAKTGQSCFVSKTTKTETSGF
jgi:hypothetical protein